MDLIIVDDLTKTNEPVVKTRNLLLAIVLIGSIALVVILYFLLRQILLRRLDILHEGADQLGRGNNFASRLPGLGNDEIGALASAFNRMAEWLQSTTVSRDHLEALVGDRTEELARQAGQLEVALAHEQKHNTLQREFVAMVSHEFRTPLAIIDGAAQRIERRKDKMRPGDLSRRVVKIRNAVTRMADLIEGVLSSARLEAGKMEKKGQEVDLADLVTEICQRQQEISTEHAISVDIAASGLSVWGDPKLLGQVFTNLLSNAVKYSPSDPRIEVRGWLNDGHAVVTVRDYGLGIPSEEVPKLFERYYRATTSTGIAGSGIGLHLAKDLIDMHDGSISVESV